MARYFARIIRAVIVSSLGFGGGIGLFTFIAILVSTGKQDALGVALQAGVIFGLGFGVLCALLLLLSDLTSRLFAAQGFGRTEVWELEQERQVEVEGTIKDARIMSRQALLAVPNVKAVADEDNEYSIRASVGASWKSPGEAMRVNIEPAAENRWRVKCISTCLSKNIAFDYGKNFENVEAWLKSMETLMNSQQQTS